jgi:trigger factor
VEEFRSRIGEGLKGQFAVHSDYRFLDDVQAYLEKKIGKLSYPDGTLKRVMLHNNKDKDMEFVNKNYDESIKQLTWHLIKEQLVKANNIKIEDNDVKEAAKGTARMQFAQYGMNNVPDSYIDNYADELLKKEENADRFVDQAVDVKLMQALKNVVKLNKKAISIDDFNKLAQEK